MSGRYFKKGRKSETEIERWKFAFTDHAYQDKQVTDWDTARMVEIDADWKIRAIQRGNSNQKAP